MDLDECLRFREHTNSAVSKAWYVRNLLEITRQLQETQRQLLDSAHRAGMAEIAANVLHNMGNSLNSMTTSVCLLQEAISEPRYLPLLESLARLLREHDDTLPEFFASDRGRAVPGALDKIVTGIRRHFAKAGTEIDLVRKGIENMDRIIKAQQEHVDGGIHWQRADVNELIHEVLDMMSGMIAVRRIRVEKDLADLPRMNVQKTRLIKVLAHVITNACEALVTAPAERHRHLTLHSRLLEGTTLDADGLIRDPEGGDMVQIDISDNGCGIAAGDLKRIFTHGFTTREDARGFGLHDCANAMSEMNGRIYARSNGLGKGATFTLQFPVQPTERSAPATEAAEHNNGSG